MTYEAWRITFQNSEQAARSAFAASEAAREALGRILAIPNYVGSVGDWEEIEQARRIAAKALGLDTPEPVFEDMDLK
jgi:hypothetical protein